ncbi:hypothetical protein JKF63_00548 [Porcisia hertigi]|uniref:Sec16 Sec23-binding domain-containing protein n=1 Tax=Porcisia hertigi TaxID=2761500 RepID=A0A836HZ95_9TRYP|nr:hypothetical protein JKF63_00548 [Porcisia hertigi]
MEVQPPPPPAPASRSPAVVAASAGYSFSTRLSGAALGQPASSLPSSNGRQSLRDSREIASCRGPSRNLNQPCTRLADVVRTGETTAPVTVAHHNRTPSCDSGVLLGTEKASAAVAEGGARLTTSAHGQLLHNSPGLNRGVPTFLQCGAADSGTRRRELSGSLSITPASRGRQLLEAALTSRGSRTSSLRNTSLTSLSAPSEQQQQQPLASVRESPSTSMGDKEAVFTVAEHKNEAYSVMGNGWGSEPAQKNHNQGRSLATAKPSLAAGTVTPNAADVLSGSGYSASLRSPRPTTCGNGVSHTRDAALLANTQAGGEPQDVNGSHISCQHAVAPPHELNSAPGDSALSLGRVPVDSRLSAQLENSNGLITGEVVMSEAESRAKANTHTLHSGARGLRPTPAGELPQKAPNVEGRRVLEPSQHNSFTAEFNPSAVAITHFNPFRVGAEKSGSSGTPATLSSLPTVGSGEPLRLQQQQQQQQQPLPPPQGGPASVAEDTKAMPLSYLGSGEAAPERSGASKDRCAASPPLPPFVSPSTGDTATPTGPATGFITPRGVGVGSVPLGQRQRQHQQQYAPLLASFSNSHVSLDRSRGPFAASPYVHDEGARSLAEESPMPVRPPFFDRGALPERLQTEAADVEGDFGASGQGAFNGIDDDGGGDGRVVRRSMWDAASKDSAADEQHQPQARGRNAEWGPPLEGSAGDAKSFSAVLPHAHSNVQGGSQGQFPILQGPPDQQHFQEGQGDGSTQLAPPPSAHLPPALSTGGTSEANATRPLPGTALQNNKTSPENDSGSGILAEPHCRLQGVSPTPCNVTDAGCHDGNPPSSNPFLEPTDSLFSSTPLLDVENTPAGSTVPKRQYQAPTSLLSSVPLAEAHHEPPPHPDIPKSPNCFSASSLELSSSQAPLKRSVVTILASNTLASAMTNTATARSPGGTALVNPFSKSAQGSNCCMGATSVNITGGGALSDGASLTGSFTGGATHRKSRCNGTPCFAIFVGGATLPPGAQGSTPSRDRKGFPCIAACFNAPKASQPLATNSGRPLMGQSLNSVAPRTPFGLPTSQCASTRANTLTSRSASSAAAMGGNSGVVVVFSTIIEALTARGSMVDRRGIRGTECGRRYVRALTDAVLPCALLGDKWATGDEAAAAEVSGVMEALKGCVSAPLGEVLEIMLKDALPQKAEDGFVWKDNGGRRLAEMLTAAAQGDACGRATTSSSRSAHLSTTTAPGVIGVTRADDALMEASPLNPVTGALGYDYRERSAALRRVEDLLCRGQRVEAAEAALEAHLYAHAILISMMCPTKDFYLRSVQAVMLQELSVTSPLAHAYSIFNEMPLPPLVPPPPTADDEEEKTATTEGLRGESVTAQKQQQIFLRDQAMLQKTWRRHAAVLLANFTRHSGDGLLQLAVTLQQLHLVAEAHTCLLLLHLTPLGMAGPVRAGAAPLPSASSSSPEDVKGLLPRPDQRQVMGEIRRRMGIVGGSYHPTQGSRAGFLTPITTVLTQLVQLVSTRLNARASPLSPPGSAEPPVPFHGLPNGQPRSVVGHRMMQVLWLRELGLVKESAQVLHALLQLMPPPLAFSLRVPPRTLNELVYLFGGVPPPVVQDGQAATSLPTLPPAASDDAAAAAAVRSESAPEREATTQQLSSVAVGGLSSPSREGLQQDAGEESGEPPHTNAPPSMHPTPKEHQAGPLSPPTPPGPQQRQVSSQHVSSPPQGEPRPFSPSRSATTQLTGDKRVAALQPPTEPATVGKPGNAKAAPALTTGKSRQSAPRRSRSLDALRNFFFRRGNSEAPVDQKADEAKPMHLDSGRPPAFDPVTGRWLFDETEEEKRLRELAKAGPPKIAPRAAAPPAQLSAAASGPDHPASAQQPQATPLKDTSLGNARPGSGAPAPGPPGGGMSALRPGGGPAMVASRDRPPPLAAGRGAARPGGRPQYVDMFNSMN